MKPNILFFAASLALVPLAAQVAPPGASTNSADLSGLFDRQNLTAWCVVPFDAKTRGPEQRAEMLQRLGFKNFAYDWLRKELSHPGSGGGRPRFNEDAGILNPSTDGLPPRSYPK